MQPPVPFTFSYRGSQEGRRPSAARWVGKVPHHHQGRQTKREGRGKHSLQEIIQLVTNGPFHDGGAETSKDSILAYSKSPSHNFGSLKRPESGWKNNL